jgi:hypothetical protein
MVCDLGYIYDPISVINSFLLMPKRLFSYDSLQVAYSAGSSDQNIHLRLTVSTRWALLNIARDMQVAADTTPG